MNNIKKFGYINPLFWINKNYSKVNSIKLKDGEFYIDADNELAKHIEIFYKGKKVEKVTGLILIGRIFNDEN